jgi:radical SAM protein with 4Fe4S-binding SPASM domain
MADAGCLFLILTGGDPLVRPDFPEIYRHARQRGMIITLFTNGTLLTARVADLLADSPPHIIDITLYGATAATYEMVTRVPGSYARLRAGIDLLLERGLPLSLKTVLLTINRHELPEIRAFAEKFGGKFRYDALIWPRLDGNRAPLAYQVSLQEMIALDFQDSERKQEWVSLDDRSGGQMVRAEHVYSCGAGKNTFHVDHAGRLSGCMMARRPAYDLLQMSFQEGWENVGALRHEKRQFDTPCRTCTLGDLCNQCPALSQVVQGDDETPVEFVCELAHLRAEEVHKVRESNTFIQHS